MKGYRGELIRIGVCVIVEAKRSYVVLSWFVVDWELLREGITTIAFSVYLSVCCE